MYLLNDPGIFLGVLSGWNPAKELPSGGTLQRLFGLLRKQTPARIKRRKKKRRRRNILR